MLIGLNTLDVWKLPVACLAFLFCIQISYAMNGELLVSSDNTAGSSSGKMEAPFQMQTDKHSFAHDNIIFKYGQFSETYQTSEGSTTNHSLDAGSATSFALQWNHPSDGRWRPVTRLKMESVEFDNADSNGIDQPSVTLFDLNVGIEYYLSKKFFLTGQIALEQEHFLDYESDQYVLKRISIPKMIGGVAIRFFEYKRFSMESDFSLRYSRSKTTGDFKVASGYGYMASIGARYYFLRKWWVLPSAGIESHSYKVSSPDYQASVVRKKMLTELSIGCYF